LGRPLYGVLKNKINVKHSKIIELKIIELKFIFFELYLIKNGDIAPPTKENK
jgi:hypothetical protein